ncbi:MAG: rod shape-determining protein RodA [Bacteroidales bacterium]|nr:rod shape-determining protein RodA [Alloprevotella sp.]MBR1645123.1 rod shape-determining protein RodA [Bacteroidales bacterium]
MNTNERYQNPAFHADWLVVVLYLLLICAGWISICGASHEIGETDFFSWGTRSGKQLVWMGCSLGLGMFLLMIDEKYFDLFAEVFYYLMLVVLIITPFIAKDIKGSRSWISLGSVSLQPAEFAKCATALVVAKLVGQYGFSLSNMHNLVKAVGFVLLPMGLIVMQKETGGALVFLSFFLVFYREGMPGAILFTAFAAVLYFVVGIRFSEEMFPGTAAVSGQFIVLLIIWLFVCGLIRVYLPHTRHAKRLFWIGLGLHALAYGISRFYHAYDVVWVQIVWTVFMAAYLLWHGLSERLRPYYLIAAFAVGSAAFLFSADFALDSLAPHQQGRVRVLLGMEVEDGLDYNVRQSKIAIGSGGLQGKGFMNGTQTKLKYVPEQETDFIFCTVGEEQGFIGSSAVLLLFLALILRLIWLAERQDSAFGRVYGYSVMSILLFHVFINVGMVMGLTPVIGIPLPFFSYGGSSLWGFTLMLFIFLRIDAGDKMRRRI